MLKKGSKLYSIFHNKCPQCHTGKFFRYPVSLKLNHNLKIHDNCDSCGLKYMIEPSFFYGAMYVSYGLTVALAVAIFVLGHLFHLSLITSFIAILVILIGLTPVTMRISRLVYINMFVHYKEKKA